MRPPAEFVSLDNDFHQLLYHYGGYDRAWQAVHNVTSHYDRVRYMTNAVIRQDENRVVEEHRRFYNYLMLGIPAHGGHPSGDGGASGAFPRWIPAAAGKVPGFL